MLSGSDNGLALPGPGSNATPTPQIAMVPVVVARIDIEANTLIDSDDFIEVEEMPEDEKRANTFNNLADVIGMLAITDIPAGSQITSASLTEPGLSQQIPEADEDEGVRPKAYPLLVNVLSGVADQLKPGDQVDVIGTYRLIRRVAVPTDYDFNVDPPLVRFSVEPEEYLSTKTIVQRAQVLKVLRPETRTDEGEEDEGGEEGPPPGSDMPQEGEPPPTDEEGRPIGSERTEPGEAEAITAGSWVVVLALSDQEIEYIEFSREQDARISLALRGADDEQFEETTGTTVDLLISDLGLPTPDPLVPPAIVDIPTTINR
jgi:pilus assembly protein CpaB